MRVGVHPKRVYVRGVSVCARVMAAKKYRSQLFFPPNRPLQEQLTAPSVPKKTTS